MSVKQKLSELETNILTLPTIQKGLLTYDALRRIWSNTSSIGKEKLKYIYIYIYCSESNLLHLSGPCHSFGSAATKLTEVYLNGRWIQNYEPNELQYQKKNW